MKKVFCILSILTMISPAMAAPGSAATDGNVATASYVKGAYNALDTAKQAKLSSSNVTQGTGAIVTSVSAADGTVTVTRTNEITIPVGSTNSATRANIWVE